MQIRRCSSVKIDATLLVHIIWQVESVVFEIKSGAKLKFFTSVRILTT